MQHLIRIISTRYASDLSLHCDYVVKPHIHDRTCCPTGGTTGRIVHANVLLLDQRLDERFFEVWFVQLFNQSLPQQPVGWTVLMSLMPATNQRGDAAAFEFRI